jgi:hypothetical protein
MIAAEDPFPVPKSGLTLVGDWDKPVSLEQVVKEFERVTDVHLVIASDTLMLLRKVPTGLSRTLDLPASRVYATVETLLAENGFVLTLLQAQPPILAGIVPAGQNPSGRGLLRTYVVTPDQLELVSQHPALQVTMVLTLPHLNVRDLSNSMRQMMQDPQVQQIIPVGNTDSIIVTGRGTEIATIARMLLTADASAARAQAENAKQAETSSSPQKADSAPK